MSNAGLLVPRRNEAALPGGAPAEPAAIAPSNVFAARTAAVRAADNPLLAASAPLLRVLADIPDCPGLERADSFQEMLIHEMREFQQVCEAADIRREHMVTARYCLCTALDEAISKTPWGESLLAGQSMLVLFHNETYGGEKFFLLLGRMSLEPAEHINPLELLYRILALGFEGRYALSADGQRQLENIQRNLLAAIETVRGAPGDVLSGHWRGESANKTAAPRFVPLWLTAALAVLVVAGAYWHFSSDLNARQERLHASAVEIIRPQTPAPKETYPPEVLSADLIRAWFSPKEQVDVRETPFSIAVSIPGAALFSSGQFALNRSIFPLLDKIGGNLKTLNRNILVVGHTDNVPVRPGAAYASNQELSERRAASLGEYLKKHSLPTMVLAVGKGELEPLAGNNTTEGRARNRRVDIHIAKRANQNILPEAGGPVARAEPPARSAPAAQSVKVSLPPERASQSVAASPPASAARAVDKAPEATARPVAMVVPEGRPMAEAAASAASFAPAPTPAASAASFAPAPATAAPQAEADLKKLLAPDINSGRAVLVEKQNSARVIIGADYLFQGKSADFSAQGRAFLDKLAASLTTDKGKINIIAHTDDRPVWNARYSSATDLSQKQAAAVRDYLRENGVAPAKIVSASGKGSTMPLIESGDNKARAKNRRVEILLTGRAD